MRMIIIMIGLSILLLQENLKDRNQGMFNKLLEIIDPEDQEQSIFGLLRMIRFDVDPEEKKKPFEKYLSRSYHIEDAKGNPGSIGQFYLTNLRIIWQMKSDNYINLTCGLQSLIFSQIKTTPVQWGSGYKHLLTIKAQNQNQTRYEFRFVGYHQTDLKLFQQICEIRKKIMQTKSFRCTNLSVKFEQQYEPLNGEEVKATYNNFVFFEDGKKCACRLFLTNVRLVVIKNGEKKMNIGIVWLMIRTVEDYQEDDLRGVRLFCRGLMAMKQIALFTLKAADAKKLQYESKSFCQIYNKAPYLGFTFQQQPQPEAPQAQSPQIQQLQPTKINLARRKNIYASSTGAGRLQDTEFNEEIGLMMERFPAGVQRKDLWDIVG